MASQVKVDMIGKDTGFPAILSRTSIGASQLVKTFSNPAALVGHSRTYGFALTHDDHEHSGDAWAIAARPRTRPLRKLADPADIGCGEISRIPKSIH